MQLYVRLPSVDRFSVNQVYNGSDVNVIAVELWFTKTRLTYFYEKDNFLLGTMAKDVNKILKAKW